MKKLLIIIALIMLALGAVTFFVLPQSEESSAIGDGSQLPICVSISMVKGKAPVRFVCVHYYPLPTWQQHLVNFFGLSDDEGPSSLLLARDYVFDGTGTISGNSNDSFCLYVEEGLFPLDATVTCQAGGMSMSLSPALTADSPSFSWENDSSTGHSIYEFRLRAGDEPPAGIDLSRTSAVEADDVHRCMQMKLVE